MKFKYLILFAIFLVSIYSCKKATKTTPEIDNSVVEPTNWTLGTLPVTAEPTLLVIPNAKLMPINVVLGGPQIFKSNNPEIFTGDGVLMQNARTDALRGGLSYPLSGNNVIYLFHINQSGAAKFYHLMVSNPGTSAITYTSKGSFYNNSEKPLTGAATGQSYFVAKDWLNNTLRQPQTAAISLNPGETKEIFKLQTNISNMIDARFEVNTSGNAYYYTVVTTTGNLADAITATAGVAAPGTYLTEGTNAYGREAGIYQFSDVTAVNDVPIPNKPAYIGYALNTSNKFVPAIENQTAPKLMSYTGSSAFTYGNYGHKYSVKFRLLNKNTGTKTVKFYMASNTTNATQSNATWNSAIKLNNDIIDVYVKLNDPRQLLRTFTVPTGQFDVNLEFYIPGLISANQQLIFETN